MKTFQSDISNKPFSITERVSGKILRPSIIKLIQIDQPQFTADNYLSLTELNMYREKDISNYLSDQIGELSNLDKKVIDSLANQTILSTDVNSDEAKNANFGQKITDKVATFGGS